mgnify:CR=1 FL=1
MMVWVTNLLASLFAGTVDRNTLLATLGVAAGAVVVRCLCTTFSSRMGYLASSTVKKTLREKIYGKLLRLGSSYQEKVNTSEVVQVAVEGVDQLETYFWFLPSPTLLCRSGTGDPLCGAGPSQPPGSGGAVGLRPSDSGGHCGGAALGQKAAGPLLGAVHGVGGFLPGKPPGADHVEDLSGRRVSAGRDESSGREVSKDHHESADHAAQLHYHHGPHRLRRGVPWG